MAVERWGCRNFYTRVGRRSILEKSGQIPLQVDAERQEVWDDQHTLYASGFQTFHRAPQVRFPQLEERGFNMWITTSLRQLRRHRPNGLVGRFDPGAVRENDDPCGHEPAM